MSYLYSAENRLVSPANYQYAVFGGLSYLSEYLNARQKALDVLGVHVAALSLPAFEQMLAEYAPNAQILSLGAISIKQAIETRCLLDSLLSWALSKAPSVAGEVWLHRLIQRFEVGKRLYDAYLPGFRKSDGGSAQIVLYVLFAAVLYLRYSETKSLQCLSTLLKVTDLLCSLPATEFPSEEAPLFAFVVGLETTALRQLAGHKGVHLAS